MMTRKDVPRSQGWSPRDSDMEEPDHVRGEMAADAT